jgi:hypothetical protein
MEKMSISQWVDKWAIHEDDPMYGAILAVRESKDAAAQAARALEEIRAAVAQIPVAAEESPRIVESVTGLRDSVDKYVRETCRMQDRMQSLFANYNLHLDNVVKIIHMEEPRDRERRADAIAKEILKRVDSNLIAREFHYKAWPWIAIALFIGSFAMGFVGSRWQAEAHDQLVPAPFHITSCKWASHGNGAVCDLAVNKKRSTYPF